MTRIKQSAATALRGVTKLMLVWGLAGAAHAGCTLTSSPLIYNMGDAQVGALPASGTPGYKRMGSGILTIAGNCAISQNAISLRFDGLVAVPSSAGLVQWGSSGPTSGALAFRIERATVDGTPVAMTLASNQSAGQSMNVALSSSDTVTLDLRGVTPQQPRTVFSLQLSVLGLLPNDYVTRSKITITSNFTATLVGAQ